jgi:hypothetical protein
MDIMKEGGFSYKDGITKIEGQFGKMKKNSKRQFKIFPLQLNQ